MSDSLRGGHANQSSENAKRVRDVGIIKMELASGACALALAHLRAIQALSWTCLSAARKRGRQ